ncbi:MAG: hypothetical protein LLG06_00105 [Desulfobacteraceae bacterium]|nr:hypothetical protein [Desulfobacteraceae bacterium]
MTRLLFNLIFGLISVAGFGLIIYGVMLRPNAESRSGEEEKVALGFGDTGESQGFLDFDTGHEGLKSKEKETFDPEKHVPEVIESKRAPGK